MLAAHPNIIAVSGSHRTKKAWKAPASPADDSYAHCDSKEMSDHASPIENQIGPESMSIPEAKASTTRSSPERYVTYPALPGTVACSYLSGHVVANYPRLPRLFTLKECALTARPSRGANGATFG